MNIKWTTLTWWGWCGWIYVGAATGTLATNKEFGRLVTGTALTWSGIWSTSIITGGPGWGGWCCRGTVDPMVRGHKLLFVEGWNSLLCDGWWWCCCCCCCWKKGQAWLDELLKWRIYYYYYMQYVEKLWMSNFAVWFRCFEINNLVSRRRKGHIIYF